VCLSRANLPGEERFAGGRKRISPGAGAQSTEHAGGGRSAAGSTTPETSAMTGAVVRPLRIGVNALYLIPGGVGGTEIYLRSLLTALAEIDHHNHYFIFTNRETGPDLVPEQAN